jgi:hypothetical protein
VEVDGGVWPKHQHAWVRWIVNSNVASVHNSLRRKVPGWQDPREADPEGEAALTSTAPAPASLGAHGRAAHKAGSSDRARGPTTRGFNCGLLCLRSRHRLALAETRSAGRCKRNRRIPASSCCGRAPPNGQTTRLALAIADCGLQMANWVLHSLVGLLRDAACCVLRSTFTSTCALTYSPQIRPAQPSLREATRTRATEASESECSGSDGARRLVNNQILCHPIPSHPNHPYCSLTVVPCPKRRSWSCTASA